MTIDESKLNVFMQQFVADGGAIMHAATVVVGDRLGLYKAIAEGGPGTVEELAKRTQTDARYLREWLSAQAASGYVDYDPKEQTFSMNEVQAFTLAQEGSPAFIPGVFEIAIDQFKGIPKMVQAMKTGLGIGWHEHDQTLFHGTERFFRSGYNAHLVNEWLPALNGTVARLEEGGLVADVGCGHGVSTIIMAKAFPKSTFVGFDYHAPSIDRANEIAKEEGLPPDRVHFEVAGAKDYPGRDYDLVAFFDCLHDMGDPVGAGIHVHESLKDDGKWMIVEPFAGDKLEDNLNPVGRIYYSASTFICTPASRAQEVGACLGAQAGEARMKKVTEDAGFHGFRRAAETPFNLIYEATV